jgi:hypothetical protein
VFYPPSGGSPIPSASTPQTQMVPQQSPQKKTPGDPPRLNLSSTQWSRQPEYVTVPSQSPAMRGGVYYPSSSGAWRMINAMPSEPMPQTQIAPPPPRMRKALTITVRTQQE